jgi:hypothetical protein
MDSRLPTQGGPITRSLRHFALLAALAGGLLAPVPAAAAGTNSPPVQLTADQDHQRVMQELGMTSFRRRFTHNYDESLAAPYPNFPDPLVLKNGRKVNSARVWWRQRRPEILEDYEREFYGRLPASVPAVKWETTSVTNRNLTNGNGDNATVFPVVVKQLVGHVDSSSYTNISVNIQLSLTLPANAAGRSPVIMVINSSAPGFAGGFGDGFGVGFGGSRGERGFPTNGLAGTNPNASAFGAGFADFGGSYAPAGTNDFAGRGGRGRGGFGVFGGFGGSGLQSWQAAALRNGWGYATLGAYSVQSDGGAGFTSGIIGLCNHGQPRKLDDWGVLRAWAWGASRALDCLETDKAVNAKKVGLEGHSRFGKAAIVAMAFDQRFAICYSSSSGFGGAEINRRNYGEVLENGT